MGCQETRLGLLKPERVKEILASQDVFIQGLSFAKQKEVVNVLTGRLYQAAFENTNPEKVLLNTIVENFVKDVESNINSLQESIEDLELLNDDNSMQEEIDSVKLNIADNKSVIDNIDKFRSLAKAELEHINFIRIKKLQESSELVSKEQEELSETPDMESSFERTSFSDNFSIELSSRDTISTRMKKFLSYITEYEYQDGIPVQKKSFIGTEIALDFNYVYKELHSILHDLPAKYDVLVSKLDEFTSSAITEQNPNYAWLQDISNKLSSKDSKGEYTLDEQIRKEFVTDMTKHRIKMKFISYELKLEEDGFYHPKLKVYDDDSSSISRRIQQQWKKSHLKSSVVVHGLYDENKLQSVKEKISTLRNTDQKDGLALAKIATDILHSLGINAEPIYVNSLFLTSKKIYYGSKSSTGRQFFHPNGPIDILLKQMSPGSLVENSDVMNDNIVFGLVNGSSSYVKDQFAHSFRIGDKIIYTYTNNHYTVNRVNKLTEESSQLRSELSKSLFAKESLYLAMLNNEDTNFRKDFEVSYVSLHPLKTKRRRSKEANKISPTDMEIVKVGFFNNGNKYNSININGKPLSYRKAQYFLPTNSDKERILLGSGLAFDSVVSDTVEDNSGKLIPTQYFKPEALDLMYESVVKAEINRIFSTSQPSFDENIDLADYNGKLFYLFPSLNDLTIKQKNNEGDEVEVKLLDLVQSSPQIDSNVKNQIKAELVRTLIDSTFQTLESYKSKGLIVERDGKYFPTNRLVLKSTKAGKTDVIASIMNMKFNYFLFNANMFQLIVGDPSNYAKGNIKGTYANIGKRLAAEIAPGNEFESEDYIQLYAKDKISTSVVFKHILKILDNKTLQQFNSMSEDQRRKLKSFPYTAIKGTDAQEITTWKEHLDVLKGLGRISKKEYEEASDAFSNKRLPTKRIFDKVLQPLKPVYVNNKIIQVGDFKIDKKIYIKTSSFPLIPALTKNQEIDKLRLKLEDIASKNGNKGVRLVYKSGVKVGFPKKTALTIFDEAGNITDFQIDKPEILSREGFKIQQDKPYDPKKLKINSGAQAKKLLFANFLNTEFDYKDNKVTGEELRSKYVDYYKQLYDLGIASLKDRIGTKRYRDKKGNSQTLLDIELLSSLLKGELRKRGEDTKVLIDGLEIKTFPHNINGKSIVRKDFAIPLWASPNADIYASLLISLVKNSVVKQKLTGRSEVLASQEGFKPTSETVIKAVETGEDLSKLINEYDSILFTDSYNHEQGLLPQYTDSKGIVHPAQILVPFKFQDNDGNTLDLSQFTVKNKEGKITIDKTKLPPELLKTFGFRIPTQLHSSMSYMEIVGFLPTISGDMIVAPREFTIQMGSDFDVDMLYSYLMSTKYNSVHKSLAKIEEISDYKGKRRKLAIDYKLAKQKLQENSPNDYKDIFNRIVESIDIFRETGDTINENELGNFVGNLYPDAELNLIKNVINLSLELDNFDNLYKKSIHNSLLDIHLTVVSSPQTQSSIITPLGLGQYLGTTIKYDGKEYIDGYADLIDTLSSSVRQEPIISDIYQTNKFYDGTEGKDGISMFSADSIFNALAQDKELQIQTTNYLGEKVPIQIEFGNKYDMSNGILGRLLSLKKDSPRKITEIIAAAQNLSVDNANEQGMYKVNMNKYTFNVYSILNFLGFEEDVSTTFISQPIIKDFVKLVRESESITGKYNPDRIDDIIDILKKTYDSQSTYTPKDQSLADFKGKDASKEMLDMIKDQEKYIDFGKHQVAILLKFLQLQEYERYPASLKKYLNIDSKGFNKNMFINKLRYDKSFTLNFHNIKNAESLLGTIENDEFGLTDVNPTTLAGLDTWIGTESLLSFFGNEFVETNPSFMFKSIYSNLAVNIGRDGNLSASQLKSITNGYKDFLLTNFKTGNIDNVRKVLFTNTKEGSLYDNLNKLKDSIYWKKNTFLNGIAFQETDGVVTIDFNNTSEDILDDNKFYLSFLDMFRNDSEINGVIPSIVAEQLAVYGILRGTFKARQFTNLIPVDILNEVIGIPSSIDQVDTFIDQWIRHNPEETQNIQKYTLTGSQLLPTEGIEYSQYIHIVTEDNVVKVFKKSPSISDVYHEISQLGNDYITEYNIQGKAKSIFKSNRTVEEPLKKDIHQIRTREGTYISGDTVNGYNIDQIQEEVKLDYSSSDNLIQSIIDQTEYPELSNLALVIQGVIPDDITLIVTDTIRGLKYNPDSNTITIGKEYISTSSSHDIITGIMHEYMHSVTLQEIDRFSKGSFNQPAIQSSLSRINDFKNRIISNLTEEQSSDFKAVMLGYLNSVSDNKLNALLNNSTIHGDVLELINKILTYRKNPEFFIDGKFKSDIEIANKQYTEIAAESRSKFESYYSLLNLSEFVAVSSTRNIFKELNVNTSEYKGLIQELFQAILELLGFSTDGAQMLASDILTVAKVSKEDVEKIQKTKVEKAINNDLIYSHTDGNSYIIEKGSIYNINNLSTPVIMDQVKRSKFTVDFINAKSKNVEYSMSDFSDSAQRKFRQNGKDYNSIQEYKQNNEQNLDSAITESYRSNPIYIAKMFKYVADTGDKSKFGNLYNELLDLYDYMDSIIINTPKQLDINYSKENLPPKNVNTVVVTNETYSAPVSYATDAIIESIKNSDLESIKDQFSNFEDQVLKSLEKEGEEVKRKCKSKTKASKGMKSNFKKGFEWSLVKDLKGFPSHTQGGVDLKISNGKVTFSGKNGTIEAKHGLLLHETSYARFNRMNRKGGDWEISKTNNSKVYAEKGLQVKWNKKNTSFEKGHEWNLIKDLKGFPSHNSGGINIFVEENGNIGFTKGETKIKAACGCVIPNKSFIKLNSAKESKNVKRYIKRK